MTPFSFSYAGSPLDYGVWRNWNIACNDQWPPSAASVPNRTETGVASNGITALDHLFNGAQAYNSLIAGCLQAASNFMNFCAALENLALLPAVEPKLDSWQSFVAQLKSIIVNDTDQDFAVPAALALLRLSRNGPPDVVKGPAPGMAVGNSVAVTLTYQ